VNPKVVIAWTPDTIETFTQVKHLVEQCPKLFFPSREKEEEASWETVVETDACQYGIGECIYERPRGTKPEETEKVYKRPIAFISKTLSPTEQRWSTIEQEQYAIFYALREWEHLLRGRRFIFYEPSIRI
jgi:hypothetical protein